MPTTTALTPDDLDFEAAALYDTSAWQQIVAGWPATAPDPTIRTATEHPVQRDEAGDWRSLLTVPVEQLITTALDTLPATPPAERPLPGRLGAALPDRLHTWRRIGQSDIRPSVHLAYARQILTEWGWQNQPYRLRNTRGARCLCGALLTAHRLGYGSTDTMHRAGAWILTELRTQGWTGLIGPWNRTPSRTADHALELIGAATRRAAHAGE
ncbi:hypothetical protein [Streptomyces sp. NPDC006551]|uniref:DUF6197 family protein n=1 Tax=Streptomyces sp. NPDC006551 TaxID=3157178 RepID=UPI0033B0511F